MTALCLSTYGNTCHLCRRVIRLDLPAGSEWGPSADHLLPRSRGGSNSIENLRPAHLKCNKRRGNSLLPAARRRRAPRDGMAFFKA